jgi:large conductance mechanosensitive channel
MEGCDLSILDNSTVSRAGKQAMGIFDEFKAFILRGNVVDLAVGIIIGAAFSSVVNALVKDLITPLIGIFGGFSFPNLTFTIHHSNFLIGEFINTIISFLIIALVIFFFVVKPVNALMARYKPREAEPSTTRECPFCLSTIPIKATRCAYCTSQVPAVEAPAAGA